MNNEKRSFIIYMTTVFSTAWILQFIAALKFKTSPLFTVILTVVMFTPTLGVLIAQKGLGKGISYKLNIRKNLRFFLIAWFLPALFTAAGAVIYFAIFQDKFDPDFGYFKALTEKSGVPVADGTIQGIPVYIMVIISIIQAVTFAPLINMFFAVGEEIGWRGYMTPQLQKWFGKGKGVIISGIIWGLWHAPVIIMADYNYGTGYFGAPFTGALAFCIFTTALGTIASFLYEKTNCIWAAALIHGSVNAVVGAPLYFCNENTTGFLLGPLPIGLISGIPLIITSIIIFRKK